MRTDLWTRLPNTPAEVDLAVSAWSPEPGLVRVTRTAGVGACYDVALDDGGKVIFDTSRCQLDTEGLLARLEVCRSGTDITAVGFIPGVDCVGDSLTPGRLQRCRALVAAHLNDRYGASTNDTSSWHRVTLGVEALITDQSWGSNERIAVTTDDALESLLRPGDRFDLFLADVDDGTFRERIAAHLTARSA